MLCCAMVLKGLPRGSERKSEHWVRRILSKTLGLAHCASSDQAARSLRIRIEEGFSHMTPANMQTAGS